MISFREKETICENLFRKLPQVYHVCTPENYEVIFTNANEYAAAVGILGICCKLFPSLILYTFQIMSNHFHLVVGGDENEVRDFTEMYIERLQRYLNSVGKDISLNKCIPKYLPIEDLDYFRSSIAYVNRNGFVINDEVSPYSCPWGAGNCYFNHYMKRYYGLCKHKTSVAKIRSLICSKRADNIKDLFSLDNQISPLSFCDIETGEKAFRDEKNYFYSVSKKLESYGAFAKIIGEMIAYSDEDIYNIAGKKSQDEYGVKKPSLLDKDAKLQLAKDLHFQYNAGKKQIQRVLKIDSSVLDSMF